MHRCVPLVIATDFAASPRGSERFWWGAVAQLGERVVRNDEVSGSIPLSSTRRLGTGFPSPLTNGPHYADDQISVTADTISKRTPPCQPGTGLVVQPRRGIVKDRLPDRSTRAMMMSRSSI